MRVRSSTLNALAHCLLLNPLQYQPLHESMRITWTTYTLSVYGGTIPALIFFVLQEAVPHDLSVWTLEVLPLRLSGTCGTLLKSEVQNTYRRVGSYWLTGGCEAAEHDRNVDGEA